MTSDGPDIEALISDGRLRLQDVDLRSLATMLEAAETDVATAAATVAQSPSWAETMLYEAGLRACRVIVQAGGFRISADRGHVTAIDAADALTHGAHHRRFVRLHRMRRVRHEFMYEVGRQPTQADLDQERDDVESLVALARGRLHGAGPADG